MDKLIEMMEYYLHACVRTDSLIERRTFFDQATGATQMYCLLNIKDEPKVLALWDNHYRPEFENLVYGI